VKSTGRPLGGPKNDPPLFLWREPGTQMVSPDSTASSMVNEMSGAAHP
jgi:hypothetical protein